MNGMDRIEVANFHLRSAVNALMIELLELRQAVQDTTRPKGEGR